MLKRRRPARRHQCAGPANCVDHRQHILRGAIAAPGDVTIRTNQDQGLVIKPCRLRVFDPMNSQGYFAQSCGFLDRIGGNVGEFEQREAVAEQIEDRLCISKPGMRGARAGE